MQEPIHDQELNADLIGYHLGLCDQSERARLEHALGKSKLTKACSALDRILAPLDSDEIAAPPANLVKDILDRIDARGRLPLRPAPSASDQAVSSPLFSMRELLSVAAAIAMFVGIFIPGYRTARFNSQRSTCMDHMRQVGAGLTQYADLFGGTSPVASPLPDGVSWARTNRTGLPRASNSQNAFILVGRHFVSPSAFHCPGREEDITLNCSNPEDFADFPDPRNNSYTSQLVTHTWQQQRQDPNCPMEADQTPLVDQQRQLIEYGPIPANSSSHRGMGQNVLRIDGRVVFERTPNVGIDNDDIYRVIGVQQYTGLERPRLRSDAFLVP